MKNLWHDITFGSDTLDKINAVIEVPQGSQKKYEIDKETGRIAFDRTLAKEQVFPFHYGFIPQTLWYDEDPLDVVIISENVYESGAIIEVLPLAVMYMIDGGQQDDKIIAVPHNMCATDAIKTDIMDIDDETIERIRIFFETYKKIEGEKIEIAGFGDKDEALHIIAKSIILYKEKFHVHT